MSDDTLLEAVPAHAPLGPSSAEGWSTCADYVNANRGLPNFDTRASAEGTFAHWVSETALALGMDAHDMIGLRVLLSGFDFEWTEDDADLLQPGIEFTRSQPGLFFGEQRVDISTVTLPGQFGTCDRATVHLDHVTVNDLKWGRGIAVTPAQNKQIMLYALGFVLRFGREKLRHVRLINDQPRHAGGGGVWECSVDDLLDFGRWIKGRAALTADPAATRTASIGGCIWCRRRKAPGGCSTFNAFMMGKLGMDVPALALPENLTPETRSQILASKGLIVDWLNRLGEAELTDALAGLPTPGRKAVPGTKTPTKWRDREVAAVEVQNLHGDQGFTKMLKTPKQLTKAVGAEGVEPLKSLIDPGERRPVMVPAADARDAIVPIESKFDDLIS